MKISPAKTALQRNTELHERKKQKGLVQKNIWIPFEKAKEIQKLQKQLGFLTLGDMINALHDFYVQNQ